MMGKTHLIAGMAASLAACLFSAQPASPGATLAALAGGAAGGVLADIDTLKRDRRLDALTAQAMAFAICALVFAADRHFGLGIWASVMERHRLQPAVPVVPAMGFVLLWIAGFLSDHRGFTHSAAAMAAFSGCVALIHPGVGFAFAAGYASHLLLDLLNRKGLRLFFPLPGRVSLGLCHADRTANAVLLYAGLAALIVLLVWHAGRCALF